MGVAFKANTDDVRYSPAIEVIERFLADGAHVRVYDPKAANNMRILFPNVAYCTSLDEAVTGADALLLLTEWDEFKHADLAHIAVLVNRKIIVDGRNLWDPRELKRLGFMYRNVGRKSKKSKKNLSVKSVG